jgi:hypothetical protein
MQGIGVIAEDFGGLKDRVSELITIDMLMRETYTAPTSGRTAQVHTARHLTLFTVLSTHSLSITVRCAAFTTVVGTITADALRTTAAIDSQSLITQGNGH